MADYQISSPDGAVYKVTAPDDAPQEAVMAYVRQQHESSPQNDGLLSRIGQDYNSNVNKMNDIAASQVNGDISAPEAYGRMALKYAQIAPQAVGEAISSIPGVKEAESGVYSAAKNLPSFGGGTIGQRIPQELDNFQAQHPLAAGRIGSALDAGNLLAAITPIKGESLPSSAVAGAGKALDTAGNVAGKAVALAKTALPDAVPTSEQVLARGSKSYEAAYNAGAGTNAQATNAMLMDANKAAAQNTVANQVLGDDSVNKFLHGLNSIANQPLSLQDAHAIDKALSDKINVSLRSGANEEARRFGMIQDAIRQHLQNPDPANITGGPQGYAAWQEGNRLWSIGKKMEQVEGMQQSALGADVPSTALKNGARTLQKKLDKVGGGGYTDEQAAALSSAAKTGPLTGITKNLGSKLIGPSVSSAVGATIGTGIGGPIGGAIGGTLGAGAGYMASAPFRSMATAMQNAKVNRLLRSLHGK